MKPNASSKNVSYRLLPFGASAPPPAQDLAQLHAVILPTSPISLLGNRFMERFYYATLPREKLICGAVAYVDDEPAGFVAATHDSAGFMRSALRRWWPNLLWVIGTSVLISPKTIGAVWDAWRAMTGRRPTEGGTPDGEILSLGVISAYRELRFIRQTGIRISTDLLENAVAQLRVRGTRKIRSLVEADNLLGKAFLLGLGWTPSHTQIPGRRISSVEFVWRDKEPLKSGGHSGGCTESGPGGKQQ